MKNLIIAFFGVVFTQFTFAQTPIPVKVSGNIFNASTDTVVLAKFVNNTFVTIDKAAFSKTGDFSIETKVPFPDFYVLVIGNDRINLILREESDIQIYGDGKDLNTFCNILGSDETKNMKVFVGQMRQFEQVKNELTQQMRTNVDQKAVIEKQLQGEYNTFIGNRQIFVSQNPNSPALIPALSTYNPEQEWDEFERIAKQIQNSLPGSPSVKGSYENYEALKKQKEALNFLAPGNLAPDFEELMVDGKTKMKLSDLRGKVVLLDFWASWCGPCRQENPNVVNLYNQYKDKGFTVMSVSLDKDGEKWKQAIKQDKLTWPNHVSDLKGWSAAAGKIYQVRGIPFTVLIDKEGKIIQTNLRGPALEQELKRILGE